ncbi:glycosyltransferase [Asticcacaulis sp. ZE23SCel15]|uniref:glycosyltransferase n=1 Tax=Asticcacaulis sp. ZE23SCel15 TaxID=3059027 RepID=UPI00265FDBF6|nr:glycosyltransferase [Asticcacaulis sp. ZE23SCel15]WKL59047.1 glycosyltransferase [Asticcacaulis sp. ZE23SCel15]
MRVLYLVHDLEDAAVRRRTLMLEAGGARVYLAGFRRSQKPADDSGKVIDLGETRNGAFAHRAAKTITSAPSLIRALKGERPDIIIARNLEMLFLARQVARRFSPAPVIVYESLDIHRLLLRRDFIGALLRGAERSLMSRASLVVTSSPAFVENYFAPMQNLTLPVFLLENKVLDLSGRSVGVPAGKKTDGVITIGWFGALRCRKSLDLLSAFARLMAGRVKVVMRGKPAYNEFEDFDAQIAAEPYISFGGPYRAEDLSALYAQVDLTWAIDFFEEGQNSKWLLPNRLYEGSRYGSVPIAMSGTETGKFVSRHGIGLTLDEATPQALMALFETLTPDRLSALRAALKACPPSLFTATRDDCVGFVDRLKTLQVAHA